MKGFKIFGRTVNPRLNCIEPSLDSVLGFLSKSLFYNFDNETHRCAFYSYVNVPIFAVLEFVISKGVSDPESLTEIVQLNDRRRQSLVGPIVLLTTHLYAFF